MPVLATILTVSAVVFTAALLRGSLSVYYYEQIAILVLQHVNLLQFAKSLLFVIKLSTYLRWH